MSERPFMETAYLRRENNLLRKKLKEVSEVIHTASKALYELEFGMGLNGIGDLDTGKEVTERPDIVERLVTLVTCGAFGRGDAEVMLTAADEIVRLRALITERVDAYADAQWNPIPAAHHRLIAADTALREEANR